MSATKELERLMDLDMWEEVAFVFGGYLAPTLVQAILEGRDLIELPNEVYGLATIVGAGFAPGLDRSHRAAASVGGGVYVTDTVVNGRIGAKQRLLEMAA